MSYAKRYTKRISFGGVDLTSPRFSVSSSRAIDASNYVWRHNHLSKRYGVEPLFNIYDDAYFIPVDYNDGAVIPGTSYTATSEYASQSKDAPIYGIWALSDTKIVFQKGRLLFGAMKIDDEWSIISWLGKGTSYETKTDDEGMTHRYYNAFAMDEGVRATGFVSGGGLWLLTGKRYIRANITDESEFNGVVIADSTLAKVPLTTIGITPTGGASDSYRQSYDDTNLLNSKVKNGCVGGIQVENYSMYRYALDRTLDKNALSDVKVEIESNGNYDDLLYNSKNPYGKDVGTHAIENFPIFQYAPVIMRVPSGVSFGIDDLPGVALLGSTEISFAPLNHGIGINDDGAEAVNPDTGSMEENTLYAWKYDYASRNFDNFKSSTTGEGLGGGDAVVFVGYSGTKYICAEILIVDKAKLPTSAMISDVASPAQCIGAVKIGDFDANGLLIGGYLSNVSNAWDCAGNYDSVTLTNGAVASLSFQDNTAKDYTLRAWSIDNELLTDLANKTEYIKALGGVPSDAVGYVASETENDGGVPFYKIWGFVTESELILFDKWTPLTQGDSNITITFKAIDAPDFTLIDKCTFGHLFGANKSLDRLFVSGNKEHCNIDWHTDDTDIDYGDFAYIPSESTSAYGTDKSAVVGYGVLSDGKLLVVKERCAQEPSIYYVTGTYTTATDDSGNAMYYPDGTAMQVECYPITATNSRIGGKHSWLFADFCGDALFVDDTKRIVGMDDNGSEVNAKQVASTRSECIDRAIQEEDTDHCCLYEDGNTLYYATPNALYVTDYETGYEWFKTDLYNVECMCNIGDDLVMGDSNGNINRVVKDRYYDVFECEVSEDEFQVQDGQILFASSIKKIIDSLNGSDDYLTALQESYHGDNAKFEKENYKALAMSSFNFSADSETIASKLVAFENTEINGETYYRFSLEQQIEEEDPNASEYESRYGRLRVGDKIQITDGNYSAVAWAEVKDIQVVEGKGTSPFVLLDYNNAPAKMSAIERMNPSFSIVYWDADDEYMDIEDESGDAPENVGGNITFRTEFPVASYYLTAPFTAGTIGYRKTIWAYTIGTDAYEDSWTQLRKATDDSSVDSLLQINNSLNQMYTYDDYDYGNMNFNRMRTPEIYTSVRPFSVPFICFDFISEKAVNSTLTYMEFTYSEINPTYAGK